MTKGTLELLAPYVPFFQTVIWLIFIVAGVIAFRRQIMHVLRAIHRRIEKGSSFKAGPVELGADLKGLAYASPNVPKDQGDTEESDWANERRGIYQSNKGIFLTHVISPSQYPGQEYDIFIYLIRHKTKDFSDVEKAEFFFGHMWGNQVLEESEKNGIIGVSTSAYGPFLCTCCVYFKDGTQIKLSRYIDFEMGRVFD